MSARIFNTSKENMIVAEKIADMLDENSSVTVRDGYVEIIAPSAVARKWMQQFPDGAARKEKEMFVGNGQYFWYCNIALYAL